MPVASGGTSSLVLGDVDGDDDLDLVVGNTSSGQSRLYLNLQRQLDAPRLLCGGQSYQLDVYSRYGPASQVDFAFPYLSFGTSHTPTPFGTLGLDPNLMFPLPAFYVPQPAGAGSWSILVPNLPGLIGLAVHTQAYLVQHPIQTRLTNVNTDILH